jgi:hypothetical protein
VKATTMLLILLSSLKGAVFVANFFWHHKFSEKNLSTFFATMLTDNLGPQGKMKNNGLIKS